MRWTLGAAAVVVVAVSVAFSWLNAAPLRGGPTGLAGVLPTIRYAHTSASDMAVEEPGEACVLRSLRAGAQVPCLITQDAPHDVTALVVHFLGRETCSGPPEPMHWSRDAVSGQVSLRVGNATSSVSCFDRQWEMLVVAAASVIAAGVGAAIIHATEPVLDGASFLPLLALPFAFVTPRIIAYLLEYVFADGRLVVDAPLAPMSRLPLALVLLALRLVVPGLVVLLGCARVAPHLLDSLREPRTLSFVGAFTGVACTLEALKLHYFLHPWDQWVSFIPPPVWSSGVLVVIASARFAHELSSTLLQRLQVAPLVLPAASALVAQWSLHASSPLWFHVAAACTVIDLAWACFGTDDPASGGDSATALFKAPPMMEAADSPVSSFARFKETLARLPLVGERLDLLQSARIRLFSPRNSFAVAVLCGPRGIGKSRFVRELSEGARVFVGQCGEEVVTVPFAPLRDALGLLIGVNRFTSAASQLSVLSGLSDTLMDASPLTLLFGINSDTSGPSATTNHARLASCMVAALVAEARKDPASRLVLCIEDAQCLDAESQALVKQLVALASADPSQHPFTVLLSIRTDSGVGQVDVGAWAASLCAKIISLAPLSLVDVRALLAAIGFHATTVDECAPPFFECSGGSPLMLQLLLDSLDEDVLAATPDGWRFRPGKSVHSVALPAQVQSAVEGKLARLNESQRDLLHFAALMGLEFDYEVVLRASGQVRGTASKCLRASHSSAVGLGGGSRHHPLARMWLHRIQQRTVPLHDGRVRGHS